MSTYISSAKNINNYIMGQRGMQLGYTNEDDKLYILFKQ